MNTPNSNTSSEVDNIFNSNGHIFSDGGYSTTDGGNIVDLKRAIKSLIQSTCEKIISEDEETDGKVPQYSITKYESARNNLRNEQRQKLTEILK